MSDINTNRPAALALPLAALDAAEAALAALPSVEEAGRRAREAALAASAPTIAAAWKAVDDLTPSAEDEGVGWEGAEADWGGGAYGPPDAAAASAREAALAAARQDLATAKAEATAAADLAELQAMASCALEREAAQEAVAAAEAALSPATRRLRAVWRAVLAAAQAGVSSTQGPGRYVNTAWGPRWEFPTIAYTPPGRWEAAPVLPGSEAARAAYPTPGAALARAAEEGGLASLTGLYLWVQTLGAAAPAYRQATGRDRGWEPAWLRRDQAESLWLACREAWGMPRK